MRLGNSIVFKELDDIESTCLIIFYVLCYNLPHVFHVLKDWLRIFKISLGRLMYPSLIAGEDYTEFALEGRNLEVEAMLIAMKDSYTTLPGCHVGWVWINNMAIWCLVGLYFGPPNPLIAFENHIGYFIGNCCTKNASYNSSET